MRLLSILALLAPLWLAGCGSGLRDPVAVDFEGGVLDLRSRNFATQGPVLPRGWLWDADALWSPVTGGRPSLPPATASGPLEHGGTLAAALATGGSQQLVAATARMTVLVDGAEDYGLQIGAFPGAYRVWVNSVKVRESGFLSTESSRFRPGGAGALISIQPQDGRFELVVEMVTSDPLVRHSEMNRHWVLGPAEPMLAADRAERNWRSLQVTTLALGLAAFLWISRFRPERASLLAFAAFLLLCLLKMLFNVEQPEPFLSPLLPEIPLSVYLLLNHGLNLLPFPLFVLFLSLHYPEDVASLPVVVLSALTAAATVWELVPFVALSVGASSVYELVMKLPWSSALNLYVVLATLFVFERLYRLYLRKRGLSVSLFFGGIVLGLSILIPIPLSLFVSVKYTYFLGWGLFLYLLLLCFGLIRLQVRESQAEVHRLNETLARREALGRFIAGGWAPWLGRDSLESLRPGDRRLSEALLVQIRSPLPPEKWLGFVGAIAPVRHAVLVDWRDGCGIWAVVGWSETALAFALEVQRSFGLDASRDYRIAVTRATVEFQVFDLEPLWLPTVSGLPFGRLEELTLAAERYGVGLVLDANVQDGLAIGGWRRHRSLGVLGTEIEFYENEDETLAALKDQTLDAFEEGLAHARSGRPAEALRSLFDVARRNPFDQAAKALLTEWGSKRLA